MKFKSNNNGRCRIRTYTNNNNNNKKYKINIISYGTIVLYVVILELIASSSASVSPVDKIGDSRNQHSQDHDKWSTLISIRRLEELNSVGKKRQLQIRTENNEDDISSEFIDPNGIVGYFQNNNNHRFRRSDIDGNRTLPKDGEDAFETDLVQFAFTTDYSLLEEDATQYFNPDTLSTLDDNTTCTDDDENCRINHNETCVGDPIYCNLTYTEYMDLLYDYIYPTTPEWILIFSHSVVFIMGLLSDLPSNIIQLCYPKAKTEAWRNYCEGLEDIPATARLYKILAKDPHAKLDVLLREDGTYTASKKETLDLMIRTHFPGGLREETEDGTRDDDDRARPTPEQWEVAAKVGNALVCMAVYTNYSMRTVTNIFIVNLAVADFFVILFCLPPTVVWDVTETWFMGEAMCKVVLYFQTVSVTVSVLTLTFISIDRWYAICFPLRYRTKISRAIASVAVIWIVALLSDIPEFLVLTTERKVLRFGSNLFTQCVATWDKDTEKNFYIARFMMLYTLPLLLMTIAYFKIVRVLWKSETIPGHRESRNHQYTCGYLRGTCVPSANTSTMGQLRARRKAAKMLVAVVVMFAGCYFPVHFLNILRYTIDIGQSEIIAVLSLFSHWLCYANSAVNPVIYNFMSGKFRREFRNALEKCRCARVRVEDRSLNHSTPASRINNISPSSRSNYQLTSVRDITRDNLSRQTLQTTFIDNCGNGHSTAPVLNQTKSDRIP